jgi:hypothetical protein
MTGEGAEKHWFAWRVLGDRGGYRVGCAWNCQSVMSDKVLATSVASTSLEL